jgi:transcriptional regulator with XRE-family HTH domain
MCQNQKIPMLAEALRLIRVFNNLTQQDLAIRMGTSKSHISEIENGKKTPSLELIQKYSEAFKMPTSSILFFSEQLNSRAEPRKLAEAARINIARRTLKLLTWIEANTEKNEQDTEK